MKQVLLFGGSGQLGTAMREYTHGLWAVDAPTSAQVSLAGSDAVADYIAATAPQLVVNAAAYTKVDDAEVERDLAFLVNDSAPAAMARAAIAIGARFLHVSTDYVFDGHSNVPYHPSVSTHPLNTYGASKRAGELSVLAVNPSATVVRTSWVHSGRGVNFIATAVRLLTSGKSMRVVNDQVGSPTRATNLARALFAVSVNDAISGLLHFTDAGVASWYDVACCVLETLRDEGRLADGVTVTPVNSSAFPRPAKRPQVSLLDCHDSWTTIGWTPPHWRDGVIASTRELLHA